MKILFLIVFCLSFNLQASSLDHFKERFILVKDKQTNKVIAIKDRLLSKKFSVRPFLVRLKQDLIEEKQRLMSKSLSSHHEAQIDEFFNELEMPMVKGGDQEDIPYVLAKSVKNIKNIDINGVFDKLMKTGVFKSFERKMQEILLYVSPNVIANLQEPRFFYRKNVTHQAVNFALSLLKKRMDSVPLLSFAAYIFVRVDQMLKDQRHFSQNYFLHFAQNHKPGELGLSKEEMDFAVSSIYESRISWTGLNESNAAAANWQAYGFNKFYATVRAANASWRSIVPQYARQMSRVDFAFGQVEEDGNRKIVHLLHPWHSFTRKPAAAFYLDKPYKIYRERGLMNLAHAALGFLPINSWIKGLAEKFVDSFYRGQGQTEGALYGYFQSINQPKLADIILKQNRNPFLLIKQ